MRDPDTPVLSTEERLDKVEEAVAQLYLFCRDIERNVSDTQSSYRGDYRFSLGDAYDLLHELGYKVHRRGESPKIDKDVFHSV